MAKLLHYRKIVWVFLFLLVFTGIFTYYQLPKRDIPEIEQNIARVSTAFPGANPEEVERTVVNPLEEALLDVDGISRISSASTTGFSALSITLEDNIDVQTVENEIKQTVTETAQEFPDEVLQSEVDTDVMPSNVATYHLLADTREELYNLRNQLEEWEEELTSLNGVKNLLIQGLPEEMVTVRIDNERMKELQLNPADIITVVEAELAPGAIGEEQEEETIYQLQLEKYRQIDELESIPIGTNQAGEPLLLADTADVQIEMEEAEDVITYQDQPALALTVQAEEGINISSLQEQLDERVNSLSENLDASVSIDRFYSQSTVIDEVFRNLIGSFAISFISVLIIMFLGLPFTSALIVALAIPISILIGLIPLPYIGVDLNQISIIGMIIAIGILVDDAIVVNDNIQRRFQLGDSPLNGTIRGLKEVRVSIITSTLMIVFSFSPLTFLSGNNGDFILALPTVLIFTVLASTLLAFVFIPTLQYTWARKSNFTSKKAVGLAGPLFNKLENGYAGKVLPAMAKRPWVSAISGVIVCLSLLLLVFKVPFEFFPAADRAEVILSARLAQGTPIEATDQQLKEIEDYLLNQESDNIEETAVYTGTGLPGIFTASMRRTGENTGQLVLRIDRSSTSATAFIEDWQTELRNRYPEAEIFLDTIVAGPPSSPPVELELQGEDLDQLITEAEAVSSQLLETAGAELVTMNTNTDQPFQRYVMDRELLAEENISIDTVTRTLQLANTGGRIGQLEQDQQQLPLQVLLDEGNPDGINLENLEVAGAPEAGPPDGPPPVLSFDSFISIEEGEQLGAIPHINGERTITIEAYAAAGEEDHFVTAAQQTISELENNLASGYSLTQSGEADQQSDFFVEIAVLFVIVLFLIYLTIAIQFNSLLMPLLILGTVFLAVTGAIVGLFVSNQPLSFLAVLGIVSLSGIVVRNSIIMVEFIEQNKNKNLTVIEAVAEAGRARIRPIILTSITSIAALTPIIFTGDVLFRPLAVSIVFGLIFSTTLTLLLLPSFYVILEKIRK